MKTGPRLSTLQKADKRAALVDARDLAEHKLHLARVMLDLKRAERNARVAWDKRKRDLLDPNYLHQRIFPAWGSDMTTLQYIRRFQAANTKLANSPQLDFVNINGERFL